VDPLVLRRQIPLELALQCQLPQGNLGGHCILRGAYLYLSMLRDANVVSFLFVLVGVTIPRAAEGIQRSVQDL